MHHINAAVKDEMKRFCQNIQKIHNSQDSDVIWNLADAEGPRDASQIQVQDIALKVITIAAIR